MEKQKDIKLNFKGVVKRFVFPTSYKEFINIINNSFPQIKNHNITLTYLDEEGDNITISNEYDFENCRLFVYNSDLNLVKLTLDFNSNSTIVNEEQSSVDEMNKQTKEEPKVEEKKEEVKEEAKEVKENHSERIINMFKNGYENMRDFVEKNGGLENAFNLFKDDIHSLKMQFFKNFKGMSHCFPKKPFCKKNRNFENNNCENVNNKKNEKVEKFKNKIETKLDRIFQRVKGKLVCKMVKKYEKILNDNSKSNSEQKSADQIHNCVKCDGCGISPIRGIRYKCTVCPNFDFCEKCENSVEHDHIFMKIKKPFTYQGCPVINNASNKPQDNSNLNNEVIHRRVSCDGCGMKPIRGNRYKCTVCPNFDFCEKCKETVKHDHIFNKIEKPVEFAFGPNFWHNGFGGFQRNHHNPCRMFNKGWKKNNKREIPQEDLKKESEVEKEKNIPSQQNDEGLKFLAKEIKENYEIDLDENVILEALKKANGDVEQAMIILFS